MNTRLAAAFLIFSASLAAKHSPKTGEGTVANQVVAVQATVYADPESVGQAVGSDLQGHYIVVKISLTPKAGKLPIQLDDFLLRTDKDGERSHPFVPTQIAGQGALVITQTATGGGEARAENRPTWGMGGIGGLGSGGGIGNTATLTGSKATMQNSDKKDPLLDTLTAKALAEKEVSEPVTGLLYFPMEKQRVKDLELFYTTSAGKLSLRFQ